MKSLTYSNKPEEFRTPTNLQKPMSLIKTRIFVPQQIIITVIEGLYYYAIVK